MYSKDAAKTRAHRLVLPGKGQRQEEVFDPIEAEVEPDHEVVGQVAEEANEEEELHAQEARYMLSFVRVVDTRTMWLYRHSSPGGTGSGT
jgi:hypothetical protein